MRIEAPRHLVHVAAAGEAGRPDATRVSATNQVQRMVIARSLLR